MGWFTKRIKDPVRGSAHVASASAPPDRASSASCRMTLVVSVPGAPSVPVEKTALVRLTHWPTPGTVLPVEVERGDPTRLRILWDEVPTGKERGAAAAALLAAQLNGSPPPPPAPGTSPGTGGPAGGPSTVLRSSTVTVNGRPATPEELAGYEAMTGMDLNGDGVVSGAGTSRPGPTAGTPAAAAVDPFAAMIAAATSRAGAPAGTDRVAALERLVALRDSGALRPEEFEAEKRRLLDS